MKIDILTLFPEMFSGFLSESIIKRAIENELVEINLINIRDFSTLSHNQVDDTPYGGGPGMVMMCEPIFSAIESVKNEKSIVIMLTPQGKTFNQPLALDLSKGKHLVLLCGHYEGFDERIKSIVDLEISIGDYVLTGGELPAMVIVDTVTRLIPGVIKEESIITETFNNNLLDYPVYTKPRSFRGMEVPEVLLNGNHQEINNYRREVQIKRTKEQRPDIMEWDHVQLFN